MSILQGNSYYLEIQLKDANNNIFTDENVNKATFTIGNITKENDDVKFNSSTDMWEVYLSEDETFSLSAGQVQWQARFLLKDGTTDGTETLLDYVKKSINKVRLTGGEENA